MVALLSCAGAGVADVAAAVETVLLRGVGVTAAAAAGLEVVALRLNRGALTVLAEDVKEAGPEEGMPTVADVASTEAVLLCVDSAIVAVEVRTDGDFLDW